MSPTRVLIVEDDDAIASLVARTLADAGIESDRAATGPDGVWMAREMGYGAICLDILLPGLNGYEVCRTLRADGVQSPILMLTAKTGEYDETDGFDMGADDYLRKPFSPAVLVARVRALMRRGATPTAAVELVRGDVAFDTGRRTARVGGRSIQLTAREAKLLEVLLGAGDAPLGRDELLREVWGPDYDGDTNVVDVYVGYLRKKLGKERIENVRGIGFRVGA